MRVLLVLLNGIFSNGHQMLILSFYILTTVLFAKCVQPPMENKSISCPLINVKEVKLSHVKECLHSLQNLSLSEHCNANPGNCEQVLVDCGQASPAPNGGSTVLLCVWRNCLASCSRIEPKDDTNCTESCLGLKGECDSSQTIAEQIDCHVKLAKEKATQVSKKPFRCPLLPKTLDTLSKCIAKIVDKLTFFDLKNQCERFPSVCKHINTDDCHRSLINPWFDARLLCVLKLCQSLCPVEDCVHQCLGKCDNKEKNELLNCHIETSSKFYAKHKDCPVICSEVNDGMKPEDVTACVQQMATMNMDRYCEVNKEECQQFPDNCFETKVPLVWNTRQVDPMLACLGFKCSKACREWHMNEPNVQECRVNCIGNIDNCSEDWIGYATMRLKCHIDHSMNFIKEGTSNIETSSLEAQMKGSKETVSDVIVDKPSETKSSEGPTTESKEGHASESLGNIHTLCNGYLALLFVNIIYLMLFQ